MEIKLTKFDPAADRIFPGGELRQLATGYKFTEGPVWDIRENCLYFTEFQDHLIIKWTETRGTELYRRQANRPIGLSMDADGRIVSAESSSRGIAWADSEKSILIAGTFQGKRFNSPNDVVVSRDGEIFFTDPYSDSMKDSREIAFNGVYGTIPGGETRLICDSIGRPNGIAFSPDESILYVNDTNLQCIFSFNMDDINDGAVSPPKVFAELDISHGPGAPDGMKVDTEGNVYVTGPGGLWALSPEGKPLAILHSPEFIGNFCFGGRDSKTLYITASTSVYAAPAGIPGIVPYRKVP